MRYVGGKGRIARSIVDTIRELSPNATVAVEPFMGGGGVTAHLAEHFRLVLASDAHPDVALLWKAVVERGWSPPTEISEAHYTTLKSSPNPSPLRGFVGFGGSFGGKWFGGYARGGQNASGAPRNHQAESARAVERIGAKLRAGQVVVKHCDYRDAHIRDGEVVYCDPPYANTLGYSTDAFDSAAFWEWATTLSARADVYVSEYRAPDGWESVWSAEKRQSVTRPSQGRAVRTEHLFRLAKPILANDMRLEAHPSVYALTPQREETAA